MDWLTKQFELSRGDGHNERAMEGLRGFAVFLVFLVHFVTLMNPWISDNSNFLVLTRSLHTVGNTGVDLFFVLSGYLIYGSLLTRRQQFLRFMARRVQRIYPAFAVVFLTYVALSFALPAENKIPTPAISAAIYLLQNFFLLPGMFAIDPMITVAWSLSYEMFYYLAIPLLILLFRMRERDAIWRTTFFLSLAILTTVYCALYGGHVRLIMFMSGIVLVETIRSGQVSPPPGTVGVLALVVGLLSTLLPIDGSIGIALKTAILSIAFFALCLTCFHNPVSWLSRRFSWTPLRWLGNMSYSYYLLHGLALNAGFLALRFFMPASSHGAWLFWILLPPMFLLTLVPTAALFLLVERPYSLVQHKRSDLA